MNSKYITYIAIIVAIAAILSSAIIYQSMQNQINALQTTPTPSPIVTPTPTNSQSQPITVVDDEGQVLTLNSVPQRIVSLAPSNTQILFAVGVGNKVVGVTDYDSYPYNFSAWFAAKNMTSIGGYSTPNKETIASLNPDLIVATTINDVDVVTLRSLGYKVLVLNPNDLKGVLQDIAMVGRATGADANATTLVNSINTQINAITAKIAAANITDKPKVYYEVWGPPAGSFMGAGSTSFINDIITKAGGINIFGNLTEQYPLFSSETVVQLNPDVIILPTDMGGSPFYGSVEQVKARPGWNSISAVQNNRVIVVSGDLFAEAGPRIADQIITAAKAFYPDLFNSP